MLDHTLPLFEKAVRSFRRDTALRHEGSHLSYGALGHLADRAAWLLSEAGVRTGHRVALFLGNSPDYLILDLALLRVGAVKVPLNPMLSQPEIRHILDHARPACVVTNGELVGKLGDAGAGTPGSPEVLSLGDGLYRTSSLEGPIFPASPAPPEATAVIYYTGGTTGGPKGVRHSHRSVAANLLSHVIEGDIRRAERLLVMTPLSHSAGLHSAAGLLMGATITIHRSFTVADLIKEVSDGYASWAFLVPTMIYRLLDELTETDGRLTGLDTIVYGASPITPNRLRQALSVLDAGFIQLYGQTECPNFATTLDKREHLRSLHEPYLLGSCGKASTLADVEVMVDGKPANPGEIGEVCLRAPYVMDGYLDDPEATSAALAGGWLHTGDMGLLDDDGYLYLKDRKKDMIISGGMNVYPAEVEAVLARLPGVARVAVVGVPHETWGESVHAVIVPEAGSALDEQAVIGFARAELGSYKRPKTVEFADSLPLTAVGKVDKKLLRNQFWTDSERHIH